MGSRLYKHKLDAVLSPLQFETYPYCNSSVCHVLKSKPTSWKLLSRDLFSFSDYVQIRTCMKTKSFQSYNKNRDKKLHHIFAL